MAQNQDLEEKPVVIVFTDGEENRSREHTRDSVARLIDARKAEGWVFAFLGANVDAFAEAGAFRRLIARPICPRPVPPTSNMPQASAPASNCTSNMPQASAF